MAEVKQESLSGITEGEAKEFHKIFTSSILVFFGVAAFAHLLVWIWRPWVPGPNGYSALETLTQTLTYLS
ncbi:light-harvesting antenna LH1, beta subunit [Rhodospirillum rubrum]|uniref:Light-harvesting protein B-870 beta chain n=3 Tax=Rhodospirillum rubrum TaxID=1085 RepID=LHB_RHORT|nr:light-harvesting antenna LH1, beta subunit [Rhodospirillum rubrum]Q2RQ23.1 RecName: Full=Light-harvesting protein B-870 beta chain; AltName: Full=Antenna pigment protein beta chain; AltName: Full=LH-1; Flags: Precursor [Rhodospirillum rubrum ATCC 11170]AAA26461.1 B880 holochrome beta precursor [Rhodospirillum rubrum]ABC23772.1 Antenna complex, alpha/beta subunit [Rhodospirillum rubrum ATCC 11170]AEO49512.1 antenna complex, alpha/subunit beta [Rhodospirillum rubrum F11]MBK5955453.1 light-har